MSIYFTRKSARSAKEKSLRHRFRRVGGKEEVAVAELFLVRANHELNIAPPSTRNRTESLKEGKLDLQRAYGAESRSSPSSLFQPHTYISPLFSVLSPLHDGI